jgi:polar amino acid transport system substrate-binding protein
MKKILTIMLAAMTSALVLGSCGSSSGTSTSSSTAANRLEAIKEKGVIVLATSPDFAPQEFEDVSSGETKYVGCDIDLAQYVADYLGVTLEIQAMDFQACQAAVSTGKADFSFSGYAYKEDRAENYEITDFFNTDSSDDDGQVVIVPQGTASDYQTAEDFAGKVIGCQNGSLQYSLTESQLPDAEIKLIDNLGTAVLMVQQGKIDALACSGTQAKMYAEKNDGIDIAEWQFVYSSEGNIGLVMKGETELVAAINEAIAEVNEQGLYAQWKEEATTLAKSLGIEVDE